MKFGLALWCLMLVAGAARAQDVSVDFDRNIDFASFSTYSWASGVPAKNPLIDRQIRLSIEGRLLEKGLRGTEEGGELNIMYIAAVGQELEVATANWVATGNWMSQARTGFSVRSQMWDVQVGTLIVCIFDATGKNLLWRGTAKTVLEERSRNMDVKQAAAEDAAKVEKKIRKAVEKMFKKYPRARAGG